MTRCVFPARPSRLRAARAAARSAWRRTLAGLAGLLLSAAAALAQADQPAQPIPGEVSISTTNGFARLLFQFRTEVPAQVQVTGSILIVSFQQPVDLDVDRLNTSAPDYISAARRDPDGMAVRIALARKLKPNLMPAAEKLFLDLLPDDWKGLKPGLPQEVVNDLARRVREAEKKAHLRQQLSKWKKVTPTRVQVAVQPTFIRYIFPLSSNVAVASDRAHDGLTLVFDSPLHFDLADAVAMLPPFIAGIQPKLDEDAASVHFAFKGKVDVRGFREDSNYVVDVSATALSPPRGDPISRVIDAAPPVTAPGKAAAGPDAHAPETVPATPAPSPRTELRPPPATAPAAAPTTPLRAAAPPKIAAAPSPPSNAEAVKPRAEAARAALNDRPLPKPAVASPSATAVPAHVADAASAPTPSDPRSLKVEVGRQDNSVRLLFPFATPTPAAVFRRADVMWIVFDSDARLDLTAMTPAPNGPIRAVNVTRDDGLVLRLKLDRPRLSSLTADGPGWTLAIGDSIADPSQPVLMTPAVIGPNRAGVAIPFENPQRLHRLNDPEVGDSLFVVTALGPVRGLLQPHSFVEFNALASTQGIVIEPLADDVMLQLTSERVVIGRPDGLTLSAHVTDLTRPRADGATTFDIDQWKHDRSGNFIARQNQLINTAAMAPPEQQIAVHVNLARFYLARQMYQEAKAAMDMAFSVEHAKTGDSENYVLRAVAKIMSHHPVDALDDLAQPSVGNQHDAPLWRALAYAQQSKWVEARDGFKDAQMTIGTLPVELQRYVLQMSARAALEVGDYEAADNQLNDFETIGAPPELQPRLAELRGEIAERLGRVGDAISDYQMVTGSIDRRAATQARLRLAIVRMNKGDLKRNDAITELETVSVIWRGDQTEIDTLQVLARLYTQAGRIRDALNVMRAALTANAHSDVTRHIQDEAAATFESLFLSGKGEALPAIDALSLFYDFRDLTPMGRRGDEMIRRLADRLVSVDLLDQASELLQHQVDHRLEGAARAQVATRLAMVYLMNHKADRALRVLRATHISGLSNALRNRRLLLEARALSELGRPDVALEVVANIEGREVNRLRADVLWRAKRWREAAEQLERLLGSRWKDWQPLNSGERTDVLRAGIGYTLGEDTLGGSRLRERYVAKMKDGPDGHAFDVVTGPTGVRSAEFRTIASTVGSLDTLDAFLDDMRESFPDRDKAATRPPSPEKSAAAVPAAGAPAPAASVAGDKPAT